MPTLLGDVFFKRQLSEGLPPEPLQEKKNAANVEPSPRTLLHLAPLDPKSYD